jgi:hypothetical protein
MTPDERDFVLAEVEASWIAYQALLDGILETDLARPMTVGVWSGKDVVAHIATWEAHCLGLILRWDTGAPKRWTEEFDEQDAARWDAWNEAQVQPFRARLVADIRGYAVKVHTALLRAAAGSTVITADDLRGMT